MFHTLNPHCILHGEFYFGPYLSDISYTKTRVNLPLCLIKHHDIQIYGVVSSFCLGTRWKLVFGFTPLQQYRWGKSSCYLLDKRLSGTHSLSGRVEKRSISYLSGIEHRLICTSHGSNTVIEFPSENSSNKASIHLVMLHALYYNRNMFRYGVDLMN
jgi:hypothetical protein